MKLRLIALSLFCLNLCFAQQDNITSSLYETYESYKEKAFDTRRIKHNQLQPLLAKFRNNPMFTVKVVGKSIEGRTLSLVSLGRGEIDVFLWSQMHGNEPTATQAIFDILKFFEHDDFASEKEEILENLTLHFLPMLNPAGAERFQI